MREIEFYAQGRETDKLNRNIMSNVMDGVDYKCTRGNRLLFKFSLSKANDWFMFSDITDCNTVTYNLQN